VPKEAGSSTLREAFLHLQLDHPNIVRLFDVFEDEEQYHSVLEYCEGGSLSKREHPLSEKEAAAVLRQVLRALNYMHQTLKIAHRDVKAENILFKSGNAADVTVKLCDFGLAVPISLESPTCLSSIVGSPYYIAPEVLAKGYDHRCDLWSAGILLYFMLSHTFPFKGFNSKDIFRSIKKDKLAFEGLVWDKVSDQAKDLVSKLLVKSPDIRLTAAEALAHPYLSRSTSTFEPV
jgi:calcium-dependent protein kinase